MKWARIIVKSIAVTLSTTLFTTNVLLAHAPETNFWAERKRHKDEPPVQLASLPLPQREIFNSQFSTVRHPEMDSVPFNNEINDGTVPSIMRLLKRDGLRHAGMTNLPLQYGSIRKILRPSEAHKVSVGGQTIIHIQDVHRNAEAQDNISKAVQELISNQSVNVVALEGAFEPMDFSWFRNYPYQDSVKSVANYLRKEQRISGPIYTAFTFRSGQALPKYIGVDDKTHYDANVEAYLQSSKLVPIYKKELAQQVRELNETKNETFSAALQNFDARVEAYRKGSLNWGDYVRFLSKQPTVDFSPKVESLLAALEMEGKLNFTHVEAQRSQLIAQLVQKLSKVETDELLQYSAAYRAGSLNHSDFYAFLKELCSNKNLSLNRYPAMDDYIRYVLLSESLDIEGIITETAATERSLYLSLAKTDEERKLVETSRRLYLTGKLLEFTLTKEEWEEYKQSRHSGMSLAGIQSFEAFYSEAEARDHAMAENLIGAMSNEQWEIGSNFSLPITHNVVVLVTGGFHSSGIDQRLVDAGYTVVSFAPKISKIEDETGTSYLSMFTQEKTPLDKLFAGEKLFLAGAPTPPLPVVKQVVELTTEASASPGHTSQSPSGSVVVTKDPKSDVIEVRPNPRSGRNPRKGSVGNPVLAIIFAIGLTVWAIATGFISVDTVCYAVIGILIVPVINDIISNSSIWLRLRSKSYVRKLTPIFALILSGVLVVLAVSSISKVRIDVGERAKAVRNEGGRERNAFGIPVLTEREVSVRNQIPELAERGYDLSLAGRELDAQEAFAEAKSLAKELPTDPFSFQDPSGTTFVDRRKAGHQEDALATINYFEALAQSTKIESKKLIDHTKQLFGQVNFQGSDALFLKDPKHFREVYRAAKTLKGKESALILDFLRSNFSYRIILNPAEGAWGAFHAAEKIANDGWPEQIPTVERLKKARAANDQKAVGQLEKALELYRESIEWALIAKDLFGATGETQDLHREVTNKGIPNLPWGHADNNPKGFDWNNPDFTFSNGEIPDGFKKIWETPELNISHTALAMLCLANIELGEKKKAENFARIAITHFGYGLSIAGDRVGHWSFADGISGNKEYVDENGKVRRFYNYRDEAAHNLIKAAYGEAGEVLANPPAMIIPDTYKKEEPKTEKADDKKSSFRMPINWFLQSAAPTKAMILLPLLFFGAPGILGAAETIGILTKAVAPLAQVQPADWLTNLLLIGAAIVCVLVISPILHLIFNRTKKSSENLPQLRGFNVMSMLIAGALLFGSSLPSLAQDKPTVETQRETAQAAKPYIDWIYNQKPAGDDVVYSFEVPTARDAELARVDPDAQDYLRDFANTYDQALAAIVGIREGNKSFAQDILNRFQAMNDVPPKSNKEAEVISGEVIWVGFAAIHYQQKFGEKVE